MATTVTVPGAAASYISNPYGTPYNLAVAQSIAEALAATVSNTTPFAQNYAPPMAAVPRGNVGEIAVTSPGVSNIVVSDGYAFIAIVQSVPGPVTISGGGSLFVGNANTTYYGMAAAGIAMIAAGDGNHLIALPGGAAYQVGLGNGNDTMYANGTGTSTGGDGSNLFFAGSTSGPDLINTHAPPTPLSRVRASFQSTALAPAR